MNNSTVIRETRLSAYPFPPLIPSLKGPWRSTKAFHSRSAPAALPRPGRRRSLDNSLVRTSTRNGTTRRTWDARPSALTSAADPRPPSWDRRPSAVRSPSRWCTRTGRDGWRTRPAATTPGPVRWLLSVGYAAGTRRPARRATRSLTSTSRAGHAPVSARTIASGATPSATIVRRRPSSSGTRRASGSTSVGCPSTVRRCTSPLQRQPSRAETVFIEDIYEGSFPEIRFLVTPPPRFENRFMFEKTHVPLGTLD